MRIWNLTVSQIRWPRPIVFSTNVRQQRCLPQSALTFLSRTPTATSRRSLDLEFGRIFIGRKFPIGCSLFFAFHMPLIEILPQENITLQTCSLGLETSWR